MPCRSDLCNWWILQTQRLPCRGKGAWSLIPGKPADQLCPAERKHSNTSCKVQGSFEACPSNHFIDAFAHASCLQGLAISICTIPTDWQGFAQMGLDLLAIILQGISERCSLASWVCEMVRLEVCRQLQMALLCDSHDS